MHLSRFFTLAELTRSDTAAREGIPNQPAEAQIGSLRTLCSALMDPLREAVGRPIRVTSGYRGPALNARIGGSATSQHSQGQAADMQAPGLDTLELFKTVIRLGLPFDQLIYEAQSATVKWVHISHRAGANRNEIRVAQFNAAGRPTGYPKVSAEQALAMRERVTRSAGAILDPGYVERADEPELELELEPDLAAASPRPAPARRRSSDAAGARSAPVTVIAKKAPARKAAAKKAAAKKVAGKKVAGKKVAGKKTAAKKAPATKVAAKKAAAKAGPAQPAAAKKVAGRAAKSPSRKPGGGPAARKRASTR
jgi:zinc D-Ala-D-Ala carboxypeptidase